MKTETLTREFLYNGARLADPSPTFSLAQVRDFYANTYPEIVNAEIEGPEVKGNRSIYTFRRAVGTKGASGGDPYLDVRVRIEAILNARTLLSPAIRAYLGELDRFTYAHVCPLLDEEIAFVDALYARYVKNATGKPA